jgi:hypothetical protein
MTSVAREVVMNVTDIEQLEREYRAVPMHDILAELAEARAMVGQLRQAVEQARLLVSGCVATWQDMVDELAQCDPESHALPDQFATDHALRRAEIALMDALSVPALSATPAPDGDAGEGGSA